MRPHGITGWSRTSSEEMEVASKEISAGAQRYSACSGSMDQSLLLQGRIAVVEWLQTHRVQIVEYRLDGKS